MAIRPSSETVKARLAEVERRYKRRRKRRGLPLSFAALRIRDLEKLFTARGMLPLPDDDAGRDDALIAAHHLSELSGDPRKNIGAWLRKWAPWLSLADAEAILVEAITQPQRWKADRLAWRLHLTESDRATLGITTIGAIDLTKAERTKRRHRRNIEAKRAARRARGAKPRAHYETNAINRQKPWITAGISRATWYRRYRRET